MIYNNNKTLRMCWPWVTLSFVNRVLFTQLLRHAIDILWRRVVRLARRGWLEARLGLYLMYMLISSEVRLCNWRLLENPFNI